MGLTDPDGRFREVNGAMETFCGLDREELLRRDWQSITHPEDLVPSLVSYRRLLEGKCAQYRLTKRYRHADGSVIWGDITVSAVRTAEDRLLGALFQIVDATGLVRRQEELNRECERFRLAAELASDMVVMVDTDLRCSWMSRDSDGRNALGWPAEGEIGVTLDKRVHPDDRARVGELTATLLASGHWPDDCLLRMRTAYGGYRWMLVKGAVLRGSDGKVTGYVSTLRDVDELVSTRQREAAETRRLQATLDSLLDPHVVIEAVRDARGTVVDFRYVAANPMACQAIGVPLKQLLGARVLPLVPALRDPELFGRYVHTLESGEALILNDLEASEAKGRQLRHYELRVAKLNDGLVCTWRDVTERAELIDTLDLLTRSSGDLVVRLDLDGIIRWVSPSLNTLLGWQPGQWLGRCGTEFLEHGGLCPGYRDSRQRLMAGEMLVCQDRIRARDGSLHWLESHISPYRGNDGTIRGMVLSCRLIDDRVEAQNALVHKGEELRRKLRTSLAAAAIAHEIKKPLSLLLMNCELAQQQLAGAGASNGPLDQLIPSIRREARTVVSTIERMNALLRSVPTETRRLDLGSVVRSALLYQRPRLESRGIRLETAGLDAHWPVQGDGGQLQIAFNNLIDNAIDALGEAARPEGRLRVSLERVEHDVQLAVDDNGPGFPALSSEQLLLRTTKSKGTGLGLYVVEQIASLHEGRLDLGRSALGGASARLLLPLAASPPATS
ncbi:MAG: hypothetical protein ER33_01275 [Cyanobium sp. CACIAM 14]|nr:MAG: hypothetical protein ER33_01275 [Cyanobium sp. CACIAM 14]